MSDPTVWSYGGGVQSAAIACLVLSGKLPQPDLAVIADTGREAETTWTYLREIIQPALRFPIHIAPHTLASVDLYSKKGDILIPAYTTEDGKTGMLPNYCSVEWKRRVVRRWLRAQGVKRCNLWLGITCDEASRMKPADVKWVNHVFPLIDLGMTRKDCVKVIEEAGWPKPAKSSCWMCPYRGAKEWAQLTTGDVEKAEEFEREIQANDVRLSIHKPEKPRDEGLFVGCDSGYCWT
jgi:hypothetical protein